MRIILHFFMLYVSSSDLIYRIRVKSPYRRTFPFYFFFFFLFPSPPAFPGHPPRPPSSFNFLCLRLFSLSTHLPTKLENVAMVSGGKKFVFDTAIYCISSNRILLSIFF